jgi:hypothetical protein
MRPFNRVFLHGGSQPRDRLFIFSQEILNTVPPPNDLGEAPGFNILGCKFEHLMIVMNFVGLI